MKLFKKKKIAEQVKVQEQNNTRGSNITSTKITNLPKEIVTKYLLFAKNEEQNKYEGAIYKTKKVDDKVLYDILILTGEMAGTLYSNIGLNDFNVDGVGSYYCRFLKLDNLEFEYLKVSDEYIEQYMDINPVLNSIVDSCEIINLDELSINLDLPEEYVENKLNNLNKTIWEEIDKQR